VLSQFRTSYCTNLWQYGKRPKRGGAHDTVQIPMLTIFVSKFCARKLLASGPSPGVRSRGGRKTQGGHILKIENRIYAASGGQTKWGSTDFKWGAGTTGPRWRRPWLAYKIAALCCNILVQENICFPQIVLFQGKTISWLSEFRVSLQILGCHFHTQKRLKKH